MAKKRRNPTASTVTRKTKKKKKEGARRVPKAPEFSAEEQAALDAKRARHEQAVEIYERGLQALQKRNLQKAIGAFESLLDGYPEESELRERCRLYLRVCEREAAPSAQPESPEELVYAATVALNNGAHDESLRHLQEAVTQDAEDERAHYMLAVVYAQTERLDQAMTHLEKAVALEPANRTLARHETDFEALRQDDRVRRFLERPPPGRRRARRASR